MQHLQLCPISHLQSMYFAATIPALSLVISPSPKESSGVSNPQPTFDCTLAPAAALIAMINSLATWTPIGPIIVPTANHKEVMCVISAIELSHGSRESKISSLCELSQPNTLPTPRAPVEQSPCSSSTRYTRQRHITTPDQL